MRPLCGLAMLLMLILMTGCEEAAPRKKAKTVRAPAAGSNEAGEVRGDQSDADQELADDEATEEEAPPTEAVLKARLAKDPKHADSLMAMSVLLQTKGLTTLVGKPNYDLFMQSFEYLQQALDADPKIVERRDFRLCARHIYYNGACALSRDKKPADALKALDSALKYGWSDVKSITSHPDLVNVRNDKGFAPFLQTLQDKVQKIEARRAERLLADQDQFAFDFDLQDSNGQPIKKADFAGKVVLVNVWGTRYPPCRDEIPNLTAAYGKYKSQGFEVVGINIESETGDVANQLIKVSQKELGISYRCALGNNDLLQQIPNYSAVPTSLFLDGKGVVRATIVGAAEGTFVEAIIDRLIKESRDQVQ